MGNDQIRQLPHVLTTNGRNKKNPVSSKIAGFFHLSANMSDVDYVILSCGNTSNTREFDTQKPAKPHKALFFVQIFDLCIAYMRILCYNMRVTTLCWEESKMRIMKSKAKDPTYHVIQDVKRDGKRSTEIIENLGHASEICAKYNVKDVDAWANDYIQKLRAEESSKDHKVLIPFNTENQIKINEQLSYNIGYLFLQKIYYRLDWLYESSYNQSKNHSA